MEKARLAGSVGYFIPVVAGVVGLSQGGLSTIYMQAAMSGFVAGYINPYFPAVSISLLVITMAWRDLTPRRPAYRITAAVVFVAFVLYSALFAVLPDYWFSLSSSLGTSGLSTVQEAVYYVLLIPAIAQAGCMFVASRALRQPWFLLAGVALLASSSLSSFYFAYPNAYLSIFGSEVFSNEATVQVVLLAAVAVLASYSFLGPPAGPWSRLASRATSHQSGASSHNHPSEWSPRENGE